MSGSADDNNKEQPPVVPCDNNNDDDGIPVKFIPFSSAVESPFWVKYCEEKLERIQLKEDPLLIQPSYTVGAGCGATTCSLRLQCQESSLVLPSSHMTTPHLFPNERVVVSGHLIGLNTLEAFQKVDKNKLLQDSFLDPFLKTSNDPCKFLMTCVLLTFADLKHHKVLYWFGFPALLTKPGKPIKVIKSTSTSSKEHDQISEPMAQSLSAQMQAMRHSLLVDGYQGLTPYFIYATTNNNTPNHQSLICLPLSKESYATLKEHEDVSFGFFDISSSSSSSAAAAATEGTTNTDQNNFVACGWPMRNLIAYLSFHLDLGGHTVRVLSYRPKRIRRLEVLHTTSSNVDETTTSSTDQHQHDNSNNTTTTSTTNMDTHDSMILFVKVPLKQDYEFDVNVDVDVDGVDTNAQYKTVGWELNARNKPGPRWVNLRPLLDKHHLAVQAADLNLKLMKWRMIPNLQVDKLQKTKVLLLGAGTLGCQVARVLLGWGIRDFTIVDYGKVSYSNPVRQSLFTLDDCHGDGSSSSGKPKAEAAAQALTQIAADVKAQGLSLSIPMPCHSENNKESLLETIETLDRLIQNTNVVFLLTDTRESRWLPTVMAAAHDKMLINAALGLDSWLVIRHGGGVGSSSSTSTTRTTTTTRYGCYFCNDVVAPENSTRNRTLDQQCTVTRPGLAPIASAMAVEVMVALLHHPRGPRAPAPSVVGQRTHFTGSSSTTTTAAGEKKDEDAGDTTADTGEGDVVVVDGDNSSGCSELGVIPHQIRGSLVSYTMMTPTVPAFVHCTACSEGIVNAYQKDKLELMWQSSQSTDGSYLEGLSGLTEFRADAAAKLESMDALNWEEDE